MTTKYLQKQRMFLDLAVFAPPFGGLFIYIKERIKMFTLGVVFMLATGVLWIGNGIISSCAARKKIPQSIIQLVTAVCVGLFCLILTHGQFSWHNYPIALILLLSGALNYLCFVLLTQAMRFIPNAVAWSIMQSALIFPFFLGIVFFDVKLSYFRLLGVVALLGGLVFMTYQARNRAPKNALQNQIGRGLIIAFAALFCAGMGQSLTNLPAYLSRFPAMPIAEKIWWVHIGTILIFILSDRKKLAVKSNLRGAVGLGLVGCLLVVVSQYGFLFRGLDYLAKAQAGSIGYPIAIGTCIAGFEIYCLIFLKEKLSLNLAIAIALEIMGITFLSL